MESFRPWLRDEFEFRCVYCLLREQWGRTRGTFELDHFLPVARYPGGERTYDNLLYACGRCNGAKGVRRLPDPARVFVAGKVEVHEDGTIERRTKAARKLIRLVGLDLPEATEFRRLWLSIIRLAERYDVALYRRLLGFPDALPQLSRPRPPGGNTRPEGVQESYFVQKQQGTLPVTY